VAAIIMVFRMGIAKNVLAEKYRWLRDQIVERDGRVDTPLASGKLYRVLNDMEVVDRALGLLEGLVAIRRQIIEPNVQISESDKFNQRLLLLGVYRNGILHLFQREGFVALTLLSFDTIEHMCEKGIDKDSFMERHNFLNQILSQEFVDDLRIQDLLQTLALMETRQMIEIDAKTNCIKISRSPIGLELFSFLSELFYPFIDSYWLSATYLFNLQPRGFMQERQLLDRIQWFAEKVFFTGEAQFFECWAKDSLRMALSAFRKFGILTTTDSNAITLTEAYQGSKLLTFVDSVANFRKKLIKGEIKSDVLASRFGIITSPFVSKM